MAEQERKTKAERRAEARAERKRAEEEAARKAQQQRLRTGVIVVAVVAVIALVMVPTVQNVFGSGDAQTTVSQAAALEARQSAGCTMDVNGDALEDRTHHDPQTAPPADVLYADSPVRPTTSGPHFQQQNAIIGGVPQNPLDERATTHNMEHGSVIVWFDPDRVDDATVGDMEDWMQQRQADGFEGAGNASVFVSPYTDFAEDARPIAIRAWGYALDCEAWEQPVADSFLIDYWGTHGQAPERSFAPFPTEALGYEDAQVEDNTEAPVDNGSSPAGTGGTDAPSDPAPTEG